MYDHEGLESAALKHPSHRTFHKTSVPPSDEENDGATRFFRWHIDAALYDLQPPKVTTLYAVRVPGGPQQVCRYDDGTHDELAVPLGTTAFVSGKTMFDILPRELQSMAVRARVKYAPHPYVWMSPAAAHSTGLKIETEGKELPLDQLPPWSEDKVHVFPVVRCCQPLPLINVHVLMVSADVEESSYGSTALPSAPLCGARTAHRRAARRRLT